MEPGRQRQFHIHHCLGRGGYGEVYRATMMAPGGIQSDVAVKLLRVDLDPGAEAVRRLRDEGRTLALLRHPAILRVFDLALLEGRVGLVTEFVEGEDLSSLIGQIPARAAVEVAATVAEALDAAWNSMRADGTPLRLVHRDIKPSNVRIGRHGEIKVLDFGIARSMAEEADREARTGTGSTVGSLAYMAPERFGRVPSAPAADVFGLGCTLFEALSGSRLFLEAVPVEMFRLASEGTTYRAHTEAALARLPAGLPPALVELVRSMLDHDPAARPTAADVRAALENLVDATPGEPLRRWTRARKWPPERAVQGYLDGRVITEGTLSHGWESGSAPPGDDRSSETFRIDLHAFTARTSLEPPPGPPARPAIVEKPRRSRLMWMALAAFVVAGVAVGATTRLPGASEAMGHTPAQHPRKPRPAPAPVPTPAPTLTPAPVPVPAVPAPIEGVGTTGVEPSPQPTQPGPAQPGPTHPHPARPVPPAPLPPPLPVAPAPPAWVEPVPAPAVPSFGRVSVVPATVRVELRTGSSALAYPAGRVPTGRYELYADFGYGMANVGRLVDVVEGYETTIRCNTLRHVCDVAN